MGWASRFGLNHVCQSSGSYAGGSCTVDMPPPPQAAAQSEDSGLEAWQLATIVGGGVVVLGALTLTVARRRKSAKIHDAGEG
jgi:heme/copper-type cytochrome/quinol oxidase subunit 2